MLSRIAFFAAALSLAGSTLAADHAPSMANQCRQSTSLVRTMWQQGSYDAPPDVAVLMVDAIDGRLPQARSALAAMKPDDAVHWRQTAMLTAVWAGQAAVVDGLLDDGAAVDGIGWVPPFKRSFYQQTVNTMKQDPRFGGPVAVDRLKAAGVVSNRPTQLGPALPAAAVCGDVATLDVLLRHHADVMAREAPDIVDALTVAAVHGDAAIVQRLLDHGADPCAEDRHIRKPGTTIASIGARNGLPAALVQRLACPAIATTH